MIRDITETISAFFGAFGYANKYGLYRFLWLSGLISLLIGGTIIGVIYFFSDDLGGLLIGLWPWEWGSGIIDSIASVISGLLIGTLGLLLYKYLVMIAVAPIMSPLSEKLENGLNGDYEKITVNATMMLKDMMRGLMLALRNIIREIFFTVILLILSLFPGVALITTPALYLVQSYYAGFGNIDYFLERHCTISESVDFIRKHRWIAITNGGLFLITLLIPIIGLFLAPFLCTIAGTVVANRRL